MQLTKYIIGLEHSPKQGEKQFVQLQKIVTSISIFAYLQNMKRGTLLDGSIP